jgi:hypothetical protein
MPMKYPSPLIIPCVLCTLIASADPVAVRYTEGVTHGYLKVQNL